MVAAVLDLAVQGLPTDHLSFWSAMMKTWQELPKTREKRVATAAFRNIVMDPSLWHKRHSTVDCLTSLLD